MKRRVSLCHNPSINRNIPAFFKSQVKFLAAQFPRLRTEEIPRSHAIYSIYFDMTSPNPPYWFGRDPQYPLYAVYDGDRLIGIIGLSGYQCGWSDANAPIGAQWCAQMVTNIYVYAITR